MASRAGPPSRGRFDGFAADEVVGASIREVEASWPGDVRVSYAARDFMMEYANHFVAEMASRDVPPEIDLHALARQMTALTREFLQMVRWDAQSAGTLEASSDGAREVPYQIVERNLPDFVAARCQCWPQ
jgi:hypothetical protein